MPSPRKVLDDPEKSFHTVLYNDEPTKWNNDDDIDVGSSFNLAQEIPSSMTKKPKQQHQNRTLQKPILEEPKPEDHTFKNTLVDNSNLSTKKPSEILSKKPNLAVFPSEGEKKKDEDISTQKPQAKESISNEENDSEFHISNFYNLEEQEHPSPALLTELKSITEKDQPLTEYELQLVKKYSVLEKDSLILAAQAYYDAWPDEDYDTSFIPFKVLKSSKDSLTDEEQREYNTPLRYNRWLNEIVTRDMVNRYNQKQILLKMVHMEKEVRYQYVKDEQNPFQMTRLIRYLKYINAMKHDSY